MPEDLVSLRTPAAKRSSPTSPSPKFARDWPTGPRAHTIWVHSAGMIVLKPIFELTVEDWRRLQTVNAESSSFSARRSAPRLNPGGAIVNLSSSSAKLATTIEVAVYAASKTTILSITRSFAYALAARPVRVNAICPGIVDTAMQERGAGEVAPMRGLTPARSWHEARNKAVPLGRGSSPRNAPGSSGFCCPMEAAYMTGQAINFTGGLVTW